VSHSAGVTKTQSRESALDERLNPGVLTLKINRMNDDNEANHANDDGEELDVSLSAMERRLPETERQELLRLRRETHQEIIRLRQENARLREEMRREMQLQEEQAETRRLFQEDAKVQLARMVRVARRRELPQRQAFETHVLERQQQKQAESVEEGAEEDADAVSSSMVEPNP